MADIVVQDNQITTVVETSGEVVVTVSGSTEVISTETPTTVVTTDTGVEILETAGDVVVTPQEAVTVIEVGGGGGVAADHTHDHALQDNLNSANYTHLTATNATDLTDAGDSALHYHAADRNTDNHISGATNKVFTAAEQTKLAGIETGAEVNNISGVNATDLTSAGDSALHYHATDRARANHTGTQAASTISDFDTEVINNTDVAANTSARHAAVTVTDTATVNLTLTGQDISADVILAAVNYLSSAQAVDLTDTGDTTLHYHLTDRIHARNSALHRV